MLHALPAFPAADVNVHHEGLATHRVQVAQAYGGAPCEADQHGG